MTNGSRERQCQWRQRQHCQFFQKAREGSGGGNEKWQLPADNSVGCEAVSELLLAVYMTRWERRATDEKSRRRQTGKWVGTQLSTPTGKMRKILWHTPETGTRHRTEERQCGEGEGEREEVISWVAASKSMSLSASALCEASWQRHRPAAMIPSWYLPRHCSFHFLRGYAANEMLLPQVTPATLNLSAILPQSQLLLKVFDNGELIMATNADLSGHVLVVVVPLVATGPSRTDEAPFVVMSFECDFYFWILPANPTSSASIHTIFFSLLWF